MANFIEHELRTERTKMYLHEKCADELKKIMKNKKRKLKIINKIEHCAAIIDEHGLQGLLDYPGMESLAYSNGFYSMIIDTDIPVRLLFKYEAADFGYINLIISMVAFQEDKGKYKRSYEKYIPICNDRYKDWEEQKND